MPGPPWLVLPTYNEAENLETVVTAARAVVDDTSPDGTGAIADRLAAAHPGEVEVLHRTERTGLGPAYLAGFARALDGGAGYVLEMDADLSHDPADIARLLHAVRAGAGLALGSRYVPGGFKCFCAEALAELDLATVRSHGYAFQVELTYRALCAGVEVVEVPIIFRDRLRVESKMSWRIAVEAAWLVPAIRRTARGAVRSAGGSAQASAAARRSDV